jgi:hypothetical protein
VVKIGFIVEGTSDFIILKSEKFLNFLKYEMSIESSEEFIIIARSRSTIKTNFISFINKLKKDVEHIFILVDQDDKEEQKRNRKYIAADCPIVIVDEITGHRDNSHYISDKIIFVIMTREMEAWFLADDFLGYKFEGLPECILNPSTIIEQHERTSNHVIIAKRVASKFSLKRAAEFSPSANRFLTKLTQISPLQLFP